MTLLPVLVTDIPAKPAGAVRLAHTADHHHDRKHRTRTLNAFDFAIEAAIEAQCDVFLTVGDLWDGDTLLDDEEPIFEVRRRFRHLSDYQVDIITLDGNHDPQGSLRFFEQDPRHTIITQPQMGVIGREDAPLAYYSALPYPTKAQLMRHITAGQEDSDRTAEVLLRQMLTGFNAAYKSLVYRDLPHILLYHNNVSGCKVESGQTMYGGDVMLSVADLDLAGADVNLLGHIHIMQQLGERTFYSGSLVHRNYGERGYKYMLIVDVWHGGYQVYPVQLPSAPRVLIELEYDEDGVLTVTDPAHTPPLPGSDVKLRFTGTEEQIAATDRKALAAEWAPAANEVVYDPIKRPRDRMRAEQITKVHTLPDKIRVYAESISREVTPGIIEKAEQIQREVRP